MRGCLSVTCSPHPDRGRRRRRRASHYLRAAGIGTIRRQRCLRRLLTTPRSRHYAPFTDVMRLTPGAAGASVRPPRCPGDTMISPSFARTTSASRRRPRSRPLLASAAAVGLICVSVVAPASAHDDSDTSTYGITNSWDYFSPSGSRCAAEAGLKGVDGPEDLDAILVSATGTDAEVARTDPDALARIVETTGRVGAECEFIWNGGSAEARARALSLVYERYPKVFEAQVERYSGTLERIAADDEFLSFVATVASREQ